MRPLDISGRVVRRLPQLGYVSGALQDRYAPPPAPTPIPAYTPPAPPSSWLDLINADPQYKQDLADILGESVADRAGVQGALRSALAQYGGANALRGIMGQLGGIGAGWEDLLDETTIGAAGAADTSGTSIVSQLDKINKDRLLAEEDIRAAKGILHSGQSGYEMGEARQADTIARNEAVNQLLNFLREGIGGYASRESQRNTRRSAARGDAGERVNDLGLEPGGAPGLPSGPPAPPSPPMPPAPPVYQGPTGLTQLVHNLVRQQRRPRGIGGWE